MKTEIFLLLIFSWALTSPTWAKDCPVAVRASRWQNELTPYQFEPKQGKKVDPPSELKHLSTTENEFYLLGDGHGGHVCRVVSKNGQSKILKIYEHSTRARQDFKMLQLLFRISQKPGYHGFQIAKPISLMGHIVELSDTPGRSLHELENARYRGDPLIVSNRELDKILATYDYRLKETQAALKKAFPKMQFNGVIFDLKRPHQSKMRFLLHSGNIIVSPDGTLTIIDPH